MKIKSKKLVSIVIPVFQNVHSLEINYLRIKSEFKTNLPNYFYEIIFVNDGSTDGSFEELLKISKKNKTVKVINFTRNFGQIAATLAGQREAKGQAIITLSADLQDPINLFPKMIGLYEAGSDLVICYRKSRGDSFLRRIASKFVYKIIKFTNSKIPEGGFDYTLQSRRALDLYLSFGAGIRENGFLSGDYLWSGYPVSYIPYHRSKRPFGKSQLNFSKKITAFFNILIDGSYLPIRLISSVGVIISSLGFIYALSIVVNWISHGSSGMPFSGWTPIIISILVIGGLNILMLGIIGEYIWRIYEFSKKKPTYVIHSKIN